MQPMYVRAVMEPRRSFLALIVVLASVLQGGADDDYYDGIFMLVRGFAKIYPAAVQQMKHLLTTQLGQDAPRYVEPILTALQNTTDTGHCNFCKVCRCHIPLYVSIIVLSHILFTARS